MARILVIDDSRTVIAAASKILGAEGHEVLSLDSFVDLQRRLREQKPDLILLDLHMPSPRGEVVAGFIRRSQTKVTPILIYSSQPELVLRETARRIGAVGFVAKSIDPSTLRRAVRSALARGDGE